MFQTRFTLHMFAYKHRVVSALDKMVSDAFSHADKYLETQGDKDDERTYSLTKCTENMGAFIRLNDSVLHRIRDFPLGKDPQKNQHIEAARLLVERIDKRRLYKLVHEIKNYNNQGAKMTGKQIEEEIVTLGNNFEREDIYVQVAKFDFGMGEENPLKYLNVFSKTDPDKAFPYNQNMVSKLLLPGIFSEKIVRVYCKAEDECKKTAIKEAAVKWEEKLTAATSAKQGN
ncbi:hypothetical protein EGW08_021591 [Elysia chlorotica]|uniref:Uncharacterized protein n=1 Tax=Elysia chlorotica TaxID=188477 RepID=A0A433SN80_ELYCH|nr:hypothetical protein EGW08_021591 [Elysia chlorotica]